jgi:serine/threonine protein kinase/WD40 repeat protein
MNDRQNTQRERQARDLFLRAVEMASPEAQAAFLEGACLGDESLRSRVAELLADHRQDSFLEVPAIDLFPSAGKPGDRIGRYKLLEKIGEGGMGVVYMAQQEEPVRRRVALKIIKLGMDTKQVVARFEAERQALALMDHPNIAKVLDGGATETGRPYFVMELVQGVPITEYCDKNQLPAQERIQLFILVCQAIQSAHQKGIIHRDLKPTNILVTRNAPGAPGCPMVIDFGVAKATQQKLTEKTVFTNFATMIGTPAYMSPEQAEMSRLDVDTRSDIYGLGVLLYELLTGTTPFPEKRLRSATYQEMQRIILEEEPERPSTRLRQTKTLTKSSSPFSTLHSQLSTDLDWIVMKCLEKDRTRRYETANGLATDLQRHLSNEPVLARPPSAAYKFQKAFRRNKLVYSAAIVVLAALVVGLGSATVMFLRERVALNGEQQQRLQAQSAQKAAESERQHSRQLLYASDMSLAQQALQQNNFYGARSLLDRHRPKPGEEDLRGWEWRYLWQLTRSPALATLTNRPVRGMSASFSPDGTRLAVGWLDGRVDLWDVPGRRCLRTFTVSNDVSMGKVAFSPVRNLLAATSAPKTITLMDLDSGRESVLWREPDPGNWHVYDLAFSPDGSRAVIYAKEQNQGLGDAVWVVNVSSAEIESYHPTDPCYSVYYAAARLSPDNQRLYLSHSDLANNRCSIQCLDLATGREIWQSEPKRELGIMALAVSPDGRIVVSGSGHEDHTIHVWDAATGKPLCPPLEGHTGWVDGLVFTKDGRRLISGGGDTTVRYWDTGTWTQTAVLRGHTASIFGLAVSETAQLIASASFREVLLWALETPGVRDGYVRLPEDTPWNEVLPLDHSRVMLGHSNQPPELFDLGRGVSLGPLDGAGLSGNLFFDFHSHTNWLCRWDGTNQILVEEWNGSEFIRRGAVTLNSGTRPNRVVLNLARHLVAWNEPAASTSVFLANFTTPSGQIELKSEMAGLFPNLFSEDGKYVVAAGPNFPHPDSGAGLSVWNVDTRQRVVTLSEPVTDEAFAAEGRVFVTFVHSGRAQANDILFYDLEHPDRPPRHVPGILQGWFLAVSPDGRLVAAATSASTRLCDAITGELLEEMGDYKSCFGVAFSNDGRRLISSYDSGQAVKLWDVGTRQELLNLSGTGSLLFNAKWSADGDTILAGAPWQAWHAPSLEEIAAAEAKDKGEAQRP